MVSLLERILFRNVCILILLSLHHNINLYHRSEQVTFIFHIPIADVQYNGIFKIK